MEKLKEAVERIVAPIPAEERIKNRYREELYGHLLERYQEAALETDSTDEASDRAIAGLGAARDLRRAFIRELSPLDRVSGFITFHSERRRGESIARFSRRTMLLLLLVELVPIGLLIVTVSALPADLIGGLYELGGLVTWCAFTVVKLVGISFLVVEWLICRPRPHLLIAVVAAATAAVLAALDTAAWFIVWSWLAVAYGAEHPSTVFLGTLSDVGVLYWLIVCGLAVVIPWVHLNEVRRRGDLKDWPYAT